MIAGVIQRTEERIFREATSVVIVHRATGQFLCAEPPFTLRNGDMFGGPWSSVDEEKDATFFPTRNAAARKAKELGITSAHWEIRL